MKRKITFLCSTLSLLLLLGFLVMPGQSLATPEPSPVSNVEPIIMWSGKVAEIPNGWQLCDSTNNTPDLRDRFIQGVDTGELPGQTGGSHEIALTLDNLPKHGHSFITSPAGEHKHSYLDTKLKSYNKYIGGGIIYAEICAGITYESRTTNIGGEHTHGGTTTYAGKSIPFDNRPKYYRLAFITRKPQAQQTDRFIPTFFAPNRSIVMWSGDPQALPYGWRLCDGTNEAPDLRDRFILGVKNGQDPGETGGSDIIKLSKGNLPEHYHTFTTNKGGSHTHDYNDHWMDKYGAYFSVWTTSTMAWPGDAIELDTTTKEGDHKHYSTTNVGGGNDTFDNRPPYYRLAFIITMSDNAKPSRIPKGAITMWSEDQATIPNGWCFCD